MSLKQFEDNMEVIRAPRSLVIFLIQYMAVAPMGTAIVVIITPIVAMVESRTSPNVHDILILFLLLILPLFIIAFIMLYFPDRYITRIAFDREKGLLSKIRRGTAKEEFDLSMFESIVSKTIKRSHGCEYNLILEETGDKSTALFNEETPFGARHWESFSEKISEITSLPLRKEYWVEDYNGKLSLISPDRLTELRKIGMLVLLVPLTVSFLGAVTFRVSPSARAFVLFGIISVLVNIIISFAYFIWNRIQLGKWADNPITLVIAVLTLIIPYSIFYCVVAFALMGFRFPSGF